MLYQPTVPILLALLVLSAAPSHSSAADRGLGEAALGGQKCTVKHDGYTPEQCLAQARHMCSVDYEAEWGVHCGYVVMKCRDFRGRLECDPWFLRRL